MSIIEAIILGLIQGLTEFLPISSSGHLVLLPTVFNMPAPDLTMVGLLHLGTLTAVLVYFYRDLIAIAQAVLAGLIARDPMKDENGRLGWYILVGSIPAAVAGLLFKDFFEEKFSDPTLVAVMLLVTAGLLVLGEKMLSGKRTTATMGWLDAIIIGISQMFALMPGISRSGSTIVGGLSRGLSRPDAARYSFLLGVPAIAGAGLLAMLDIFGATPAESLTIYAVGFVTAAVSGYACIHFLLSWVRKHSLYPFAIYCALVGGLYLLLG